MSAAAIDFTLPPQLEAREPAEVRASGRDDVRMLVSDSDGSVTHAHFRELPRFLRGGDLLVLNTSATVPAALTAIRENGDEIALHWSTSLPAGLAVMEPRKVQGRAGETLTIPGGASVMLLAPYRGSQRLWVARFDVPLPPIEYLQRWGRPIAYDYVPRAFPLSAYQTVFARDAGSAEMPSAGRPFTRSLLACLRRSGVQLARLLLHTGVASLENHEEPYEEWYEVSARTAELVRTTHARGGRVIAVGTTVVRALESSVDARGDVIASRGWTDVVITPERGVHVVDGLLTGLHEPRATHLAMLEAIAGRDVIARAYAAAVDREYLWHEFGDVHLLL
ncbi:MAG TPA: S-adenosylmethionine:tRNA ribosyltransferase-isomerase [Thermoanaerobaculia bacterium]|nr:S-adenosylmethionine:tRNA ribosyltransferase-isomerase [Thermoanaerobaculia bacterium]